MSAFMLLTDSYGNPCVVQGEYIVLAVKDKYGTHLTLGNGSELHVQESPEELYDDLAPLMGEFALEEDPDGDPEEDPDEVSDGDPEEDPEEQEEPTRQARILRLQRD